MTTQKKQKTDPNAVPEGLQKLIQQPLRKQGLDEREERAVMIQIKEVVWDFEKTNWHYIVFYHRNDHWWQCGDNSAMFYYYLLAKQLGLREVYLRHDKDYNKKKWKYGCIAVRNLQGLFAKMAKAGYKCIADAPEVKVFLVPMEISPDTMKTWQRSEKEKEAMFNALVVPKNIYPKIAQKAGILHREVVDKAVNLSPARQKYYGDEGAMITRWLSFNAIRMANGRMTAAEYFDEALKKLDDLNDWIAMIKKFRMFTIDADLRIVQELSDLRDLVKTERRLLENGKSTVGMLKKQKMEDVDAGRESGDGLVDLGAEDDGTK